MPCSSACGEAPVQAMGAEVAQPVSIKPLPWWSKSVCSVDVGVRLSLPADDKYLVSQQELKQQIAGIIGGSAPRSWSSGDIQLSGRGHRLEEPWNDPNTLRRRLALLNAGQRSRRRTDGGGSGGRGAIVFCALSTGLRRAELVSTDNDPYELKRRLAHCSQRYIARYANPPEHIAAAHAEEL